MAVLGLLVVGAASAQVRPDRAASGVRPDVVAPPRPSGPAAPGKVVEPLRGGQICVVAYDDRNGNGRRDGGEGPLLGQSFTIANAAGAQLAQGATGGDGRFCTPRPLPFGDYRVRQIPGGGWTNTDPGAASPNMRSVSLRTEGAVTVLFGSCRGPGCAGGAGVAVGPARGGPARGGPGSGTPQGAGQLCVTKYNDLNANGQRDPGEPPLQGWWFEADGAMSNVMNIFMQTDANGRACIDPPGGIHNIMEQNQPGWINTEPSGGSVASMIENYIYWDGNTDREVFFGNRRLATIGLKKIVSSTAPGGGYPTTGLATSGSFPVKLNCPLAAMNTLANVPAGQTVSLNNIPVGAVCTVSEILPQGNIPFAACPTGSGYWEPPLIPGSPLTVAAGANTVTVTNRFVCNAPPPPGKVCVTKYNDLNGDGARQSNEPGLTGWTFNVKDVNGVTVTTLTSTSGYPACSPFILPPGNYTITENLPATGWVNTDPGGAAVETFTVAAGGTFNAIFGNVQLGKICVRKYNDVNGNGAWSGASSGPEPFMTGVPFEVKDSSGQVVHTGLTAALGVYCTPSTLMPGVYTVTETVPGGWTNTQPGGAASVTVTIPTPYGGPTEFWLGNQKDPLPGELCVEKYNDLNGDGDQDPGEGPLQGWTFTRSGGGMPSLSGSTGANGRWCPGTLLPPGSYTVTETMKSGWTSTDPGGLSPVKTAVVLTNQTTTVKFGNLQDPLPGEICVQKYNDLNNNGSRDGGEPPLANWQFTVRNASNTIVGQGSTGANGRWCMSALAPPGTYTVTETPQAGWTSTDPFGALVKTVVVGANAVVTVWFGNRAL
ncbi:MAG: DUF5979 domain-containing protein [Caulobacter sp.]|nr:DUF5979 domain-containing protein [Caulobacter sp.]